jgi:hypothetical protein
MKAKIMRFVLKNGAKKGIFWENEIKKIFLEKKQNEPHSADKGFE